MRRAASLAAFSSTWVGQNRSATGSNPYTLSGTSLGDDVSAPDVRISVISVQAGSGSVRTISSATVGGRAATVIHSHGDRDTYGGLIVCDTTGLGSSADVVITFSGTNLFTYISVTSIINPRTGLTPHDTAIDNVDSSGLCDLSLNVPVDGCVVGSVGTNNGSGGFTWVGATETIDSNFNSGNHYGFASNDGAAGGTPQTVTVQCADTTPDRMAASAASWGP